MCIRLFPSKEQTCIHQPLKLPQNSLPHQEIQAKVSWFHKFSTSQYRMSSWLTRNEEKLWNDHYRSNDLI